MKYPLKSPINIRIASTDDATAISGMIIRNISHFHSNHYTEEELDIWRRGYSVSEIKKQILSRQTFVMEHEGIIYGSVQYDSPEIKGFYIDPDYKGMGFGGALFQFILSKLKNDNCQKIELTSNKVTTGFYEKFGFELIGEEIVHWENYPFTEYRMIKKFF